MTDRENDFNRTAQDSEGRQVQQELERQLRELGDTMSDSFRHGFEGRGEEIGDRVWDVGRAAVNAAGYGISEAGRAFQAGKQKYQKRAEEARNAAPSGENAGGEGSVVVNKVKEGKGAFGYNARDDKYEDLLKAGIIDPTKVSRVALENAASIASMFLTTECVLAEKKSDAPAVPAMPAGGMGGMM